MSTNCDDLVLLYESQVHMFKKFRNAVVDSFQLEPTLNRENNPIIHSIKSRLKSVEHLRGKISRKWGDSEAITVDNFFQKVTDLVGVRILHLYQDQFPEIHKFIVGQEWTLSEKPVAYSWDPEAREFFNTLGLDVKLKDSYTSIHYLVRPNPTSPVCCEIQVRTLFEEIWGEIDHTINYPEQTHSVTCKEQLRVLSKLVSTGTRLADSIFRAHADSRNHK